MPDDELQNWLLPVVNSSGGQFFRFSQVVHIFDVEYWKLFSRVKKITLKFCNDFSHDAYPPFLVGGYVK